MASIDELHWSAILDTADFDKKAAKLRDEAKALNKSLSDMLDIYSKFKGKTLITEKGVTNAKELSSVLSEISKKMSELPSSVKVYEDATKKANKEVERTSQHYTTQSVLLRQLASLAGTYFSVRGVQSFLKSLIDVTGQFEVQKMALASMLQSSEVADRIFNQYRQMALNSPYTFQDFTKFGKQLTAFNIPAQELIGTTKMLADVAAGLGVDMGRIILAYGQIKSAGVLKGTELRQLTEAGVPILDSLAKQIEETTGKTVKLAEVFQMISKKQIPFEMVEKAFKDMTSEGGKFYNMQEVLVETLQGKVGKLRDTWQQMLYDIGRSEDMNKILKGSIDAVTKLISDYETLGRRISDLVIGFGAYKAALIATEYATGTFSLANHKLLITLTNIGKWIKTNPYALLAAAAAAIGVAAVRSMVDYTKSANIMKNAQREQKQAFDDATISISKERGELERLAKIAGDESKSMTERQTAIDVINAQYGDYLKNLGIEKVSIDNLKTSYDDLSDAIAGKYLQQLRDSTVGNAETAKNDARAALNAFNADFIRNTKITTGKNKGKIYTAQGVGMIQGEVERFISEHPLYDGDALYKGLVGIYKKYGLDIEGRGSARQAGKLYKAAYEFSESSKILKESEKDFNAFVKGYNKDMADFQKTTDNAQPKGTVTTPNTPKASQGGAAVISEWDQVIEDIDKQLLKDIDDGTKAFDKAFEERMKALNEFDAFLDEWAHTERESDGVGVSGKVGDIIVKYKEDDYKTLVEYRKQLNNLKTIFGENTTAYANAKKKLDEWRSSMEAANKSDFFQKIRSLAGDIFEEGMFGYDLSNWGDKTIGQINAIGKALDNLDVPEDIKEALKNYPEILEELIRGVKDLATSENDNTVTPEKMKAIKKEAGFAISKIVGLSDSFAELGEAMGNAGLKQAADSISNISSVAGEAIRAFDEFGGKGGGGASAFAAYLVVIVELEKRLLELTAIDEAQRKREREARRDARATGRLQDTAVGSFFGTSEMSLMNSRIGQLQRIRASMAEYVGDIENLGFRVNSYKLWQKLFGWMYPENYQNGQYLPDTTRNLSEIAESLGMQLYDEYNNLNSETLKAILSSYEDLTEEQSDWIKKAIVDSESYAEAIADVKDILDSVFGDIASSAADNIINQWIEASSAALDYADVLDDVARRYAKMLIESSMLDQVLNKDEADKVASMFISGDVEGAMGRIAEDMQKIADMEPLYESILTAFDPYFQRGEGGGGSMANGIKGITEDTASLLASYINAIRADVSMIRAMEAVGWKDVNGILSSVGVLPTLNDYVAQVAATTANIAENTRALVDRIDRITTSASGRAALAVDVQ